MVEEDAKSVARDMIEAGHPRVAVLIFELLEKILDLQTQVSPSLNSSDNELSKSRLHAEKRSLNLGVSREF